MEFLNKVEIQGVVGRVEVSSYNGRSVCNFMVVTEAVFSDRNGNSVVESTWWNLTAWDGGLSASSCNIFELRKGQWVHAIGQLRARKYVDGAGCERMAQDVIVRSLEILSQEG